MDNILFLFRMGWPAFICLIAGLILLIVEMATPSFALPGIMGVILLGISVFLAAENLTQALVMILLLLLVLGILAVMIMRSALKGKLSRSALIQRRTSAKEEGYITNPDMSALEGRQGITRTVLRPAGVVEIDGKRIDVVTEGEFIEANMPIVVSRVEGIRVIVKPDT